MKEIVFNQVCKSYDQNQVVKNLNMKVEGGERLILLGPSGCGKSTTLRMIAGLEDITSGDLYLGDKRVNDVESGDRNVSMVFQNYALYPHMTVRQNISYALKVNKFPSDEINSRTSEAIRMLDLTGLEERKPKELSGGQRQRVALARAIVKRADYFLLDEPLSNLDAQLRAYARKELVKIHEQYHQTFVYVTHDQIEAMTVGQKIALMNEGTLQAFDTPQNIYKKPANVFTAKFIGSPPANVVEASYDAGYLYIEGAKMKLPDAWCKVVGSRNRLYFGIRPEDIHLTRAPKDKDYAMKALVRYVENYGNQLGVYFQVKGMEMLAICEDAAPMPGENVYFEPDFDKIHLFDIETTNNLGYPKKLQ
ncbi:MAG: ABC transporter ATP-binding protein [Lachnospiraceae bacterium]|nr:ABC transporter ATP-binding protein [Lachnospiraceae bacterium]